MTTLQPEFGTAINLRPYSTFISDYNGKNAAIPIMFTEVVQGTGGTALDEDAGKPGYASNLLKGIPVPVGARCLISLPVLFAQSGLTVIPYTYQFIWRLRNAHDYRVNRTPYHIPEQSLGAANTLAPVGSQDRVIIPASYNSVVYPQSEPTGIGAVAQNLRIEQITVQPPDLSVTNLPLIPGGGMGIYQQGILDPADEGGDVIPGLPAFIMYDLTALGDELLIGVTRATNTANFWVLASPGADGEFASLFGGIADGGPFKQIGVRLMIGVAP